MNTISKWLITLALLSGAAVANAQQYTIINLGTGYGTFSIGYGINASGQVTGTADGAFITNAKTHAMTFIGPAVGYGSTRAVR